MDRGTWRATVIIIRNKSRIIKRLILCKREKEIKYNQMLAFIDKCQTVHIQKTQLLCKYQWNSHENESNKNCIK